MIVARLGWRWAGGHHVALADLSVNLGTAMQLGLVIAARLPPHAPVRSGGAGNH